MKGQKKVERGVANMITDTHCPQLTSDDVPITRYHSLSKTANEQHKEKKRKEKMERHFPIQTKTNGKEETVTRDHCRQTQTANNTEKHKGGWTMVG